MLLVKALLRCAHMVSVHPFEHIITLCINKLKPFIARWHDHRVRLIPQKRRYLVCICRLARKVVKIPRDYRCGFGVVFIITPKLAVNSLKAALYH